MICFSSLNDDCEEVEALRMKIAERRISSETSSSFVMHEVLTNSAKKRQKRNGEYIMNKHWLFVIQSIFITKSCLNFFLRLKHLSRRSVNIF